MISQAQCGEFTLDKSQAYLFTRPTSVMAMTPSYEEHLMNADYCTDLGPVKVQLPALGEKEGIRGPKHWCPREGIVIVSNPGCTQFPHREAWSTAR